jgi:TPR repeat protein
MFTPPALAAPAKHRASSQSNPAKEAAAAAPTPAKPSMNPAVLDVIEARRNSPYARCEPTPTGSRWIGGCKNGYRDGPGIEVYEYKSQYSATHQETQETYAEGVEAGLRCTTSDISASDGKISTGPTLVGRCLLTLPYIGAGWWPMLRRSSSGEWHVDDSRDDFPRADPSPIVVEGAAVEQANASLIQAAQAGSAAGKIELPLQSLMLADLLPEGRSALTIDPTDPVDVAGKRVAVVLSSQALKEIDRWKAAREQFARTKGYGLLAGPADAGALAQSLEKGDPSKLVASLVSTLRTVAGSVVPAEDLSPLTRGEADYAVVADWRFDGGYFDPKQFANRPRGITDATRLSVAQQFKFLLFDQRLRVRLAMVYNDNESDIIYGDRDNAARMPSIRNWNPVAAQGTSVGYSFRGNLISLMSPEHQRQVGDNFQQGRGVPQDESVASAAYIAAASNGDVPSMSKLARYYEIKAQSYPDIYLKDAVEWYTRAAKFGDYDGAERLTEAYAHGQLGLAVDTQKVAEFAKAAYEDKRTGVSAYNLGVSTKHGWGGDPNLHQAAKYFREALELGYAGAQKQLDEIAPQLASMEAAESFASELQKVKTAAQLYALGDEQASKGDRDKARVAFRAILTRFPNNTLATAAAQRLAALDKN